MECCRHCGFALVDGKVAFCPSCRQGQEPPPVPTESREGGWLAGLTIPARIAIGVCFLVSFFANLIFAMTSLPAGQYPIGLIAVPIAVGFLVLLVVTLGVFRLAGVPIIRRENG
jgi:hypothetical protein